MRRRKEVPTRLSNDFHCSTTMDWQRARLGAASLEGALISCWKWRLTWETRGFVSPSSSRIAADGKLKVSRKCIACRGRVTRVSTRIGREHRKILSFLEKHSFLFIFLVSFLLEFLKRSVWSRRGYDGFWRLKNTGLSIPVLKSNIFRFRSVNSI